MIENITIGLSHTEKLTVSDKDTALAHKSGGLPVFATPGMIALLECAAFALLKNAPVGLDSVGIEIHVQHLRACLVGTQVEATATVTEINGNRVCFELTASDEKGEIGKGSHIRYLIDAEKFMSKLTK